MGFPEKFTSKRNKVEVTKAIQSEACWKENYTRDSAIAERPRCRVRYSFRQK